MTRLRRSDVCAPGIRRRRAGRGFVYLDADGERVSETEVLARIHELVIPPAWQDVWVCPYPGGHIQATGMDQKGRKQYLYHPRWRARRDIQKFDDMVVFARSLPGRRRYGVLAGVVEDRRVQVGRHAVPVADAQKHLRAVVQLAGERLQLVAAVAVEQDQLAHPLALQ